MPGLHMNETETERSDVDELVAVGYVEIDAARARHVPERKPQAQGWAVAHRPLFGDR
jgi:hypothetical protein